jgi:hypothetical protein
MGEKKKSKVVVKVYYTFPVNRSDAAPGRLTLDQAKKYASPKPLRRPEPRKAPESDTGSDGGGQAPK